MTRPTPEELDPLEAELQSLRPAEPPAELRDRIARDLSARAGPPRPNPWLAAGGLAAAACVVVGAGVALRQFGTPRPVPPRIAGVSTAPATAPARSGDERPALGIYRMALARSPADLDELLDRHAARVRDAGAGLPPDARITASSGFGLLH